MILGIMGYTAGCRLPVSPSPNPGFVFSCHLQGRDCGVEWENKLGVQHMSPELNGGELTEGGACLLQDLGVCVNAALTRGRSWRLEPLPLH